MKQNGNKTCERVANELAQGVLLPPNAEIADKGSGKEATNET